MKAAEEHIDTGCLSDGGSSKYNGSDNKVDGGKQDTSAVPQSATLSVKGLHPQGISISEGRSQRSRSSECAAADSKQAVDLLRRKSAPPYFVVNSGAQSIQFYKGGEMTTVNLSSENAQSWMDDLLSPTLTNRQENSGPRS